MIAIFLPPYPFRGLPAPYLWVFYKFLSQSKEPLYFITGEQYLDLEANAQRWEHVGDAPQRLNYTLPTRETLQQHTYHMLSPDLFGKLLEGHNRNPVQVFRTFLTSDLKALSAELEVALDQVNDLEAIVTWCNCPTLERVARARDLPVIHLELGPLRFPSYRSTAYLDFSGVNGNTEAHSRFSEVSDSLGIDTTTANLLGYFSRPSPMHFECNNTKVRIGLALQVEDDSNLIAFSNGYDNSSIISFAKIAYPAEQLLVRAHPGSLFRLDDTKLLADQSPNTDYFLARVDELLTINSSIGFEALLRDKKVTALGDSSYKFIVESSVETRHSALAFYLFSYLVPQELIFDIDYLRFRLNCHNERDITYRHIAHYAAEDGAPHPEMPQTLKQMIEQELQRNNMEKLIHSESELRTRTQQLEEEVRRMESELEIELSRASLREQELENALSQVSVRERELESELLQARDRETKLESELYSSQTSLNVLRRKVVAHDADIAVLKDAAQLHSLEIGAYHEAVMAREATITSLMSSTSWKLTAPLRRLGLAMPKLRYRFHGIMRLFRRDGAKAILKKAWVIVGNEGIKGLRRRASLALVNQHHSAGSPESRLAPVTSLRPLSDYLPVNSTALPDAPLVDVDVIIPVYRGLTETRNCIESVLAAKCNTPARIVVIDDCSPEPEVSAYLQSLPQSPEFIVLRNEENLGFVGTVNRGMRLAPENDVLLLNSDTEVADGWLDRLVWHAYSSERVSSVTPFSNNATICSYPRIEGIRGLPGEEDLGFLNQAFWEANAGRSVTLPTAVGFCMYIRRACLDEVGLFDEEAFGKGYGEENDFCLRALANGWTHLLATDTFVFHAGEVSFQSDSSPGKARAMQILRDRYPSYEAEVAKHVTTAEAEPMRIAATAARYRLSGLPVVLMVTHHLGGGTQKHVDELCASLEDKAHCLILQPKSGQEDAVILKSANSDLQGFDLHLTDHVIFLTDLLKSFGVTYIHIHHTVGMPEKLQEVIASLGVPFDFTVHDYYSLCPQINFAHEGRYCGEPDASGCNRCIAARPAHGAQDIVWWRQKHAWLLDDARRVICPSQDVANRVQRYHPSAPVVVESHEVLDDVPLRVPTLAQDEPLRVVLLGWLAKHKGSQLVSDCLVAARKENARDIHFHLIGRSMETLPQSDIYSESGEYRDEDLIRLIDETDPHVIWLASTWPETYSYTLSAAISAGRAVVGANLGALPERVAGRPWSWVQPWNSSGEETLQFFQSIRTHFEQQLPPPHTEAEPAAPKEAFYPDRYAHLIATDASAEATLVDLRRSETHSILVVAEMLGERPSPCAYIRVLLPLLATAGPSSNVRVIRPADIHRYVADTIYTHRIALHGHHATELVEHCQKHGMRLVYDLDDDLLGIAESEHPERARYAAYASSIRLLASKASEVRVSTPELKQRMAKHSNNVKVVPNALDASTWALDGAPLHRWAHNEVAIVYMGTMTHHADFEMVKGVLQRIKNKYGKAVSINLIGVSADRNESGWCRYIDVPSHASTSYPAFASWLIRSMSFDIGIAPLVDNEFNRAKSGIKFLDYTAMGLATLTSDVPAYRDTIENEVTGLVVPNDPEAWYGALDRLVSDATLRHQLANAARDKLLSQHTLQSASGGAPFRLNGVEASEP